MLSAALSSWLQATRTDFTAKAQGHLSSLLQVGELTLLVPLLLLAAAIVEVACVGWQRSTLRRMKEIPGIDWVTYAFEQFNLGVLVGHMLTLFTVYGAYQFISRSLGDHLGVFEVSGPAVVAYALCLDLMAYGFHRLSHRHPALWALHHFHHSAPQFNLLANFRTHPVQNAVSKLFIALPLSILFRFDLASAGAGFLLWATFVKFLNIVQHSQIASNWGSIGHVLVSPAAHRVHHSLNPDHFDRNFGNTLIIWDRLFGTYLKIPDAHIANLPIGQDDHEAERGMVRYTWHCLREAVRQIVGR